MRRVGVLVGVVLAGGVLAATATATPAVDHVHLRAVSTSADHAPFCDVPDAPPVVSGPGSTAITFTLLPPGC